MKQTGLKVLLLVLCISIVFTGCANKNARVYSDSQEQIRSAPLNIGIITDVGGINDKSFNQSAWEGLKKAQKDFGSKVSYIETKNSNDYAKNFESASNEKKDLIWGIGFMMADVIKAEAQEHPKQKYAIIDNTYGNDTPSNLVGVVFKENESSFLVGYIAGKMTKTNTVGFIGGVDSALIQKFQYGYMAGVRYANPKCKVVSEYAGSFSDPAKGKEIASRMYDGGADIIFHASGATGNGLIECAKEKGKYCIGVDSDQSVLAPDNVITSAMKKVDVAVYDVAKDLKNGKWNGGATLQYGLSEGGVDIAPTTGKLVPENILNEVNGIKAKVTSGQLKIPETKEEYDKFH
ncbi:MAG: BMP family ABC transporter substrate-binding protein [Clostridium sp.]|uniref:BMP family lipoprotein n=1 Tax=Clostridium sp. TaxID=1506 RepID=UPI0025B9DC41|nr:BMP family ABC transporter substrate-binding protein [Clostridium sp.]MCH3963612.1 BMP family ABC transporter substrate-binding protein [Clostridium sp.]MCI1714753.1 BMP family ABC transporter substrate-binding protein [Clostridium sp.]MCI1799058.1 BMP family ABC transporter substrate-binding protein [Clostridium sp.]MCI1812936.1 BMP family ABC transporter substrate-binding protein [Clostridium sp.]MCI1869826.1 BMP family ABC transporter substrate-binding protein [Clostridium sp.]